MPYGVFCARGGNALARIDVYHRIRRVFSTAKNSRAHLCFRSPRSPVRSRRVFFDASLSKCVRSRAAFRLYLTHVEWPARNLSSRSRRKADVTDYPWRVVLLLMVSIRGSHSRESKSGSLGPSQVREESLASGHRLNVDPRSRCW